MTLRSASSTDPDLASPLLDEHAQAAAFRDPTPAEIAGSASPAYVAYLIGLLDQRDPFDEKILRRLEELASARDQRATQLMHTQAEAEELRSLRQDVTEKTLQLQEERERSLRLQHENTVLHTQESVLRERLAALAALCRQRGVDCAVADADGHSAAQRTRMATRGRDPSTSPVEVPLPKSFSLRAVAAATAGAQSDTSAGSSLPAGCISADDDGTRALALALTGGTPASGVTSETRAATSTAHVVALTEEVQLLREQLDTQRSLYEHERGKRLLEHEDAHRQSVEQTRHLLKTIQHLEELHEVCVRDLVQYRHHTEKELRDCHGQIDWLKQHMQEALLLAERKTRRSAGAAVASEQRVLRRVNPMVLNLREAQTTLKAQLQEERQAHTSRVAELEAALQNAQNTAIHERARRRREGARHRLEMEGVRSELDLMRHALRQMEKRVYFTGSRLEAAATEEQKLTDDYFY